MRKTLLSEKDQYCGTTLLFLKLLLLYGELVSDPGDH